MQEQDLIPLLFDKGIHVLTLLIGAVMYLNRRFREVEEKIAKNDKSTTQQISNNDRELRERVEENSRVVALCQQSLTAHMETDTNSHDAMTEKIGNAVDKVAMVGTHVDAMGAKLDGISSRLDQLIGEFNATKKYEQGKA